jgi:long-chain acyl-CoA synthetase
LRAGLATLGITAGDRVAIISRNSSAWAAAAYATYGLGATFVPMYESQRPADWEFILRDSGTSVVLARTAAIADELERMRPRLPGLRHVLVVEAAADPRSVAALQQHGATRPVAVQHVPDETVAGLVYTSGTTGVPKGVMLTQKNLTSNVVSTLAGFPLGPDDRTVSFLPWAHVYGQVCELHILIAAGASTAFNTNTEHLLDDLRDVKPTMLVAVPRIFNKLSARVKSQIAQRPAFIQRLFWRGLDASVRRHRGEQLGLADRVEVTLAEVLFRAIRAKLGGRLRYAISGSATLSREVGELINALGIDVYEGYGLTETSPIIAFNRPGQRKLGSVGIPIADVTIAIDETFGDTPGEGELIVKGPNVMKGYHARPEENTRVFTADGGLRTGDLGRIDEDGYVYITGRIKEQYKLENGKYVMPALVEEKLAMSPFILNSMVEGSGRPYNVAVIELDAAQVRAWAASAGHELGADLPHDERVRALIHEEIERLTAPCRSYERPRDFVLTDVPFTIESGLLTPTFKLKRREVAARFRAELDAIYAHPSTFATAPAEPPAAPALGANELREVARETQPARSTDQPRR